MNSSQTSGTSAVDSPPEPRTYDAVEAVIDAYVNLREKCYQAARRNSGALMGRDARLSSALRASDISMSPTPEGVECYGTTYTVQTWDHEEFSFYLTYADIYPESLNQ